MSGGCLVVGVGGCGGADRAQVQSVTERFFAALAGDDGHTACLQLSPDTRSELESEKQKSCAGAIGGLGVRGRAGHARAGLHHQREGRPRQSLGRYLTFSDFGADVLENRQSEYLQFTLYILGTVWLLQRGSPESKPLDQAGRQSDEDQRLGAHADERSPRWARVGGPRTTLYSNSLLIVMGAIWLCSWGVQAVTGRVAYDAEQLDHQQAALTFIQHLGSSDFWNRTLQNRQSEFLAVGSMAVLSIFLRQRGSPESKPVGAPHGETGDSG